MTTDTRWVRKLDAWTLLQQLPAIARRRTVLRYEDALATRSGLALARLLVRLRLLAGLAVTGIAFDRPDERGRSLMYAANELLSLAWNRFLDRCAPDADALLRRTVKTYLRGHLESAALFIVGVQREIGAGGGPGRHVVVLDATPLNEVLAEFGGSPGPALDWPFRFGSWARVYLAPLAYACAAAALRLVPLRIRGSGVGDRPAVWVEYSPGARNEFVFWLRHLRERDFDVVYYLDIPGVRADARLAAQFEERRIGWVEAHELQVIGMARLGPRRVLRALAEAWRGRGPAWLRAFRFNHDFWCAAYRAVFERFRVRVLIQHQDRGWRQGAQARAVASAGGIMLGFHWSNLPYCMETWILLAQHVYFVWGRQMLESCELTGHSSRHILPSGIWLEPTAGDDALVVPELDPGVRYRLVVYDSNARPALLQTPIQTPEALARFLRVVLALAEARSEIGVYLKPKLAGLDAYAELLPGGPEIVARTRALESGRRFVELPASMSPITASARADLSVCFNLNSAGVVAALLGHRVVHWDCMGLDSHLYSSPGQRVLFRGLDELRRAIEDAIAGDEAVGDFSAWRDAYNAFGDFDGGRRIAWFVREFMGESLTRSDPMAALDAAAGKYRREFSVDARFGAGSEAAAR